MVDDDLPERGAHLVTPARARLCGSMSSPAGWTTRVPGALRVAAPASTSAPARDAVAPARTRRVAKPFGSRPRRRCAFARAASPGADARGDSDESSFVSLPDLTRPGLTPWDVLGVAAARDPGFEPTAGEARAAFRRQILRYHPDVYRGAGDAAAQTRMLVAALRAVLDEETDAEEYAAREVARRTRRAAKGDDDASEDAFAFPETAADAAFVNPFTCRGVAKCPSYCNCALTAPFAFEARDDGARSVGSPFGVVARFKPGAPTYAELEAASSDANLSRGARDDAESMAYRLNCAVQQCPAPGAIAWVTPKQSAFLERAVGDFLAKAGAADADETASYIAALLAKADFENERFAAPARRAPKRSGKWVDWY